MNNFFNNLGLYIVVGLILFIIYFGIGTVIATIGAIIIAIVNCDILELEILDASFIWLINVTLSFIGAIFTTHPVIKNNQEI